MTSILILDDDEHVLKSLRRLLRSPDYLIECTRDAADALAHCREQEFSLILSDQRMPAMTGTEFFTRVRRDHPKTRRILISGYTDFTSVTDAFNEGVIHKFVLKPWDNQQLKELVQEQLSLARTAKEEEAESLRLAPTAANVATREVSAESFHGLITHNRAMREQIAIIRKTASSDAPVFINGETGTGKELVARAIHLESGRADKPFVALNCANLTETLLESQLFGHRKGAFTGADRNQTGLLSAAEGGSLFLDEVVEIPLALQAKLLRVLQEKEYTPLGETRTIPFDVRVISASARSLESAVAQGRFREDLRFRLEVLPLRLPPLRERGEDKRLLFEFFLRKQFEQHDKPEPHIDEDVIGCVEDYPWPGNVRELVNVCTYIAALAGSEEPRVSIDRLPPAVRHGDGDVSGGVASAAESAKPAQGPPEITPDSLVWAFAEFEGHRESMAKYFGVSRMTLWRRMKEFEAD
ncbi:MAG: sigma-54 dependent transcriptional regulator [Pseudohongiellaceae bacterium]